jgi:hypothetical protein
MNLLSSYASLLPIVYCWYRQAREGCAGCNGSVHVHELKQ